MGNLLEWHCQLDSSGRVSLPQSCREWYSNGVVLRFWPDEGCVSGWPVSKELDASTDRATAELESLLGRQLEAPVRHTMNATDKLYLDARGRLPIPAGLRRDAGITGAVVVVAVWRYFEIWSEERWRFYLKSWQTNPWQFDKEFLFDWPELSIPSGSH